jgi:hypothetical protein
MLRYKIGVGCTPLRTAACGKGFGCWPWREQSTWYRGPASESLRRTNSRQVVRGWPSMGIWCGSGFGGGWFSRDRWVPAGAEDCGSAAAGALDGLIGDWGLVRGVVRALAGAGMKGVRRRERDVSTEGCWEETRRTVTPSNPWLGGGGRAARCAAAGKDLDNDHVAAAARTWRAIGCGVRIGRVVRRRWIDLRRRGHQLPGYLRKLLIHGARAAMAPLSGTWSEIARRPGLSGSQPGPSILAGHAARRSAYEFAMLLEFHISNTDAAA